MKIGNAIYLDHQATTPLNPNVLEQMMPFFCSEFGNPHSSEHFMGWQAMCAVDRAKSEIAITLGADTDEIIFTSGATEANNLALYGLAIGLSQRSKRNKILLSSIEHKSVYETVLNLVKYHNFTCNIIPVKSDGSISEDTFNDLIDDSVMLVSICSVNNEIGTVQNIEYLSEISKYNGALFHSDCAQALGTLNLDVSNFNIDSLSLSSHKFYGPKGIGVLYLNKDLHKYIKPIIYGGGQQNNIRSGTIPVPLCVGMGAALSFVNSEKNNGNFSEVNNLSKYFYEQLIASGLDIKLNGPEFSNRHYGNVNIQFKNCSGRDLLSSLQPMIAASTGSACNSFEIKTSYVLDAIGLSEEEANSSVRFSLGLATRKSDIEEAVFIISNAVNDLMRVY